MLGLVQTLSERLSFFINQIYSPKPSPKPNSIVINSPETLDSIINNLGGYRTEQELGNTSQSIVFQAINDTTKDLVVVKQYKYAYTPKPEYVLLNPLREHAILNVINPHHSIPRSKHYFKRKTREEIVIIEYIPGTNLNHYDLRFEGKEKERFIKNTLTSLLFTLKHIHSPKYSGLAQPLRHLDIKPENIVLGPDLRPFLIDFGHCRFISEEPNQNTDDWVIGSIPYIDPLMQNGGISSDYYSLGMSFLDTFYPKIASRFQFSEEVIQSRTETERRIKHVKNLSITKKDKIPNPLRKVFNRMISLDISQRYSSSDQILNDILMPIKIPQVNSEQYLLSLTQQL